MPYCRLYYHLVLGATRQREATVTAATEPIVLDAIRWKAVEPGVVRCRPRWSRPITSIWSPASAARARGLVRQPGEGCRRDQIQQALAGGAATLAGVRRDDLRRQAAATSSPMWSGRKSTMQRGRSSPCWSGRRRRQRPGGGVVREPMAGCGCEWRGGVVGGDDGNGIVS